MLRNTRWQGRKVLSAQKPLGASLLAASAFRSGGLVKRTYVYVDGFNLYYRALRKTKLKWLDIGTC